jgi:hypothetical protein
VEERVGEEGVKREPQTGLQRIRVHADGPCTSFATDLLSWVAFLLWKQYQSLLNREKKCRNRATDGSTPASW